MFHKKINNQKFSYVTKKCSSLTDSELKHISRLFSENYGIYSKNHPKQELQGKQIKLGLKYYQNLAKNNHNYVALAYYDSELVGQAFYVIENTSEGAMTWVIQLVIDKKYRRHQVAKKLLFSIWGFSIISPKNGQKIPKITNLQYNKGRANYGTKKKSIYG